MNTGKGGAIKIVGTSNDYLTDAVFKFFSTDFEDDGGFFVNLW